MATTVALSRKGLAVDPSANLDAATKQYVDGRSGLGNRVAKTLISTTSSSANSATLVATNVIAQFTPSSFGDPIGSRYRFICDGTYLCDSAANTCAFYVVWKHGSSIAISDPQVGKALDRSHPDAGGVNHIYFDGEFVITATTQVTVGVCVAMPNLGTGSDPGPVKMYGITTGGPFGSYVSVDRIKN